jgi:MFS family permease
MALMPEVLRTNRNFRRLFLADLTSSLGTGISTIAFPLLVLSITGNAVLAGSVATVSLATRLALRLPAGYLVDRWTPRTVMILADAVRFAALISVPVVAGLGGLGFLQLLAVAVVEGLATALFGPAVTSLTRETAEGEQLTEALGLDQAVQAVTSLLGPAVGGALYAVDRVLPFACDAATYAVSGLLLWGIRVRPPARAATEPGDHKITAGMRWLFRQRILFTIMLYAGALNLAAAALDVMVVVVLQSHGVPGSRIGLTVACAGAGAVLGSLLASRVVKALSVPTLLLGIGTGWAAILGVFALVYSPWLIAVLLVVLMTLSPAAGVAVGSALFSRTPRHLVGRVSATVSLLLTGLAAIGPLAAGVLYAAFGASGGWLCLALLTAVVTAVAWKPLQAARGLAAVETPDSSVPAVAPPPVVPPPAEEVLAHGRDSAVRDG